MLDLRGPQRLLIGKPEQCYHGVFIHSVREFNPGGILKKCKDVGSYSTCTIMNIGFTMGTLVCRVSQMFLLIHSSYIVKRYFPLTPMIK